MKKVALLLICLVMSATMARAEGEKQDVQANKLPKFTQSIIQTYFPGTEVVQATKDKSKEYDVILSNGVTLQCDKDGQWKKVDCGNEAIPQNMVPGKIQMYLAQQEIASPVVKMLKDKKAHYVIYLQDGTELHFDNQFRFKE